MVETMLLDLSSRNFSDEHIGSNAFEKLLKVSGFEQHDSSKLRSVFYESYTHALRNTPQNKIDGASIKIFHNTDAGLAQFLRIESRGVMDATQWEALSQVLKDVEGKTSKELLNKRWPNYSDVTTDTPADVQRAEIMTVAAFAENLAAEYNQDGGFFLSWNVKLDAPLRYDPGQLANLVPALQA